MSRCCVAAGETPEPREMRLARSCAAGASSRMTSTMSGAEKRALRARGQKLEATVRLGHAGITEGWLRALDEALAKDELVKVRFTDPAVDRKVIAPEVAEKSGSEMVA